MTIIAPIETRHSINAAEAALAQYLIMHTSAFASAAELLGGQPAMKRTLRLLEGIRDHHSLSRNAQREVVSLHQLLTLKNAHKAESLEAALFSEIDPSYPVVEDICELSDGLLRHLQAFASSMDVVPELVSLAKAA